MRSLTPVTTPAAPRQECWARLSRSSLLRSGPQNGSEGVKPDVLCRHQLVSHLTLVGRILVRAVPRCHHRRGNVSAGRGILLSN